jgi:hypothetical protein
MARNPFPHAETVWSFKTARFETRLVIEEAHGYRYDGADPDGEVQEKLDSGEYAAFESAVLIFLDGEMIAWDSLGGSVYAANDVPDFWTAHRDPDAMNRNCSAMRAARGDVCICHYFPGMVRAAIKEARQYVAEMSIPRLRKAA